MAAQDPDLAHFPFWQTSAGWWRSENTYFDQDLDYKIRSYNSVIHIELDGRRLRETEYKSYAPSKLATALGGGVIAADEGIEAITVTTGELVDDRGTVHITGSRPALPGTSTTVIRVLDNRTAARITADPETGLDAYQMLITLPTPDRRYVANYGLVSAAAGTGPARAGDLRGFSLFRGRRIAADEAFVWRERFREKNRVAAITEAGDNGAPVVRRLKAASASE